MSVLVVLFHLSVKQQIVASFVSVLPLLLYDSHENKINQLDFSNSIFYHSTNRNSYITNSNWWSWLFLPWFLPILFLSLFYNNCKWFIKQDSVIHTIHCIHSTNFFIWWIQVSRKQTLTIYYYFNEKGWFLLIKKHLNVFPSKVRVLFCLSMIDTNRIALNVFKYTVIIPFLLDTPSIFLKVLVRMMKV